MTGEPDRDVKNAEPSSAVPPIDGGAAGAFRLGPRKRLILLALPTLLFVVAGLYRINDPWLAGYEAFHGQMYQTMARNYGRFGVMRLRGAQVRTHGAVDPDNLQRSEVWWSRLPFTTLMYTAMISACGESGWVMRLPSLLACLALGILMWREAVRVRGDRCGLAALAFTLPVPCSLIWARMPGYEMFCLLLSTACLIEYCKWREGGQRTWLVVLLMVGAAWSGLFGLTVVVIAGLDAAMTRVLETRKRIGMAVASTLVLLSVAALYVAYFQWAGGVFEERVSHLFMRMGLRGNIPSFGGYLHKVQSRLVTYLTSVALIAALCWWIWATRALLQRVRVPGGRLTAYLCVYALVPFVFASGSVYVHRYCIMFAMPAVAWSGALGLELLVRRLSARAAWSAIAAAAFLVGGIGIYRLAGHHSDADQVRPAYELALKARPLLSRHGEVLIVNSPTPAEILGFHMDVEVQDAGGKKSIDRALRSANDRFEAVLIFGKQAPMDESSWREVLRDDVGVLYTRRKAGD